MLHFENITENFSVAKMAVGVCALDSLIKYDNILYLNIVVFL